MRDRIRHRTSFEVLHSAIPSEHVKRVAQLLGVTPDEVLRWRREPESTDNPTATGRRSPLDRAFDLIDAVYLPHPEGGAEIRDAIDAHFDELLQTHHRTNWNAHETINDVLTGATCVVRELIDGEITQGDLKALLKLKHVVDEAAEHARAAYQAAEKAKR